MTFPSTRLPVVPAVVISTPAALVALFPEITFPAPAVVPPMVLPADVI